MVRYPYRRRRSEKPIAWFSADQVWERTVRKGDVGEGYGMGEMLQRGIRLYRDRSFPAAAPLNWTAIRKQSGMASEAANHLVAIAKVWGARPFDWYGSFAPVLASDWQAVEYFFGNAWTPVPWFTSEWGNLKVKRIGRFTNTFEA